MQNSYRIAVIAGDGIGQEVMPEGIRALEAAAKRCDIGLSLDTFDFASCDYYLKHGRTYPKELRGEVAALSSNSSALS